MTHSNYSNFRHVVRAILIRKYEWPETKASHYVRSEKDYLSLKYKENWPPSKTAELIAKMPAKVQVTLTEEERETLNKAKHLLMETYGLKEKEAYIYIRNISMENRWTRLAVARRILESKDLP